MATTYAVIRQRLIGTLGRTGKVGQVIPNGFFDSAAAGSITSSSMLRDGNHGSGHYRNMGTNIARLGSATTADNIRPAGDLTNSTGLLAHTGANYADTTVGAEIPELWYWEVRPDQEILDCANRALEYIPFLEDLPLTRVADGDMQSSATTNWTASSSAVTKGTSAATSFWGRRVLHVENSAGNGGANSDSIEVTQGKEVIVIALVHVTAGTFYLQLYDATNSAEINSSGRVSTAERDWHFVWRRESVPATCKQYQVRLRGTEATAVYDVAAVWAYNIEDNWLELPSFADDVFRIDGISKGEFRATTASGVERARAFDPILVDKTKWRSRHSYPGSNPNRIFIDDTSLFNYPLFIHGRRMAQDEGLFSTEAGTNSTPLRLLLPRFQIEVLTDIYIPMFPHEPWWRGELDRAQREFESAMTVREQEIPATPRRQIQIRRA